MIDTVRRGTRLAELFSAPPKAMKVSIAFSMLFAVVGTTVGTTWVPGSHFTISEPIRLALWGLTLIAFSSRLRSALKRRGTGRNTTT